jgi:5-methylcytosine-specific restriction endonuclease McrA
MRGYAKLSPRLWTDFEGSSWPVVTSTRRLKFKYPAHAALRRHVYRRDAFTCVRCGVCALFVPLGYDGRETLYTTSILRSGYNDVLVLDHILTLQAGGTSAVENLQTLCETCNKSKQREDKEAAASFRREVAG